MANVVATNLPVTSLTLLVQPTTLPQKENEMEKWEYLLIDSKKLESVEGGFFSQKKV